MASALASPPPPWFGAADLKANARKYLERALVISAIVHLSAVLAFRVAQERSHPDASGAYEGFEERVHTIDVIVQVPPPPNPGALDVPRSSDGIITPRSDDLPPELEVSWSGGPAPGPATNRAGDGTGPNEGPLPPPDPPKIPVFRHTESLPQPLHAPIPPYPDWMREAQIEGRVLMKVLVGTDGLPKRIVVAGGSKVLGEEAAKTLRLWTFRPGLSDGKPAEVWLDIPVNYQLIR